MLENQLAAADEPKLTRTSEIVIASQVNTVLEPNPEDFRRYDLTGGVNFDLFVRQLCKLCFAVQPLDCSLQCLNGNADSFRPSEEAVGFTEFSLKTRLPKLGFLDPQALYQFVQFLHRVTIFPQLEFAGKGFTGEALALPTQVQRQSKPVA